MPRKQKLSNIDMKKELKEFKKGDIFEKQITYLLYPEEKALYSFCKKILQNKFTIFEAHKNNSCLNKKRLSLADTLTPYTKDISSI